MSEEAWIVLGLNVAALIIWSVRLEMRVTMLEKSVGHSMKRMHEIDEGGTRGMLVLVERQSSMTQHMERLETQVEQHARTVEKRIDDLFRFLQNLKSAVEKNGQH